MKELKLDRLADEEIKNIVRIQALAKHKSGFLKFYDMDDGVESGREVAEAQVKASEKQANIQCLKEMIEWIYDHSIQSEAHGEGRFIPDNNIQALKVKLEEKKQI